MSDAYKKIKKKIFYVNSYGGSGSYLLCEYLAKYGLAYHLHERKVHDRLRKASGKNTVKIGKHLAHLTVIFRGWINKLLLYIYI